MAGKNHNNSESDSESSEKKGSFGGKRAVSPSKTSSKSSTPNSTKGSNHSGSAHSTPNSTGSGTPNSVGSLGSRKSGPAPEEDDDVEREVTPSQQGDDDAQEESSSAESSSEEATPQSGKGSPRVQNSPRPHQEKMEFKTKTDADALKEDFCKLAQFPKDMRGYVPKYPDLFCNSDGVSFLVDGVYTKSSKSSERPSFWVKWSHGFLHEDQSEHFSLVISDENVFAITHFDENGRTVKGTYKNHDDMEDVDKFLLCFIGKHGTCYKFTQVSDDDEVGLDELHAFAEKGDLKQFLKNSGKVRPFLTKEFVERDENVNINSLWKACEDLDLPLFKISGVLSELSEYVSKVRKNNKFSKNSEVLNLDEESFKISEILKVIRKRIHKIVGSDDKETMKKVLEKYGSEKSGKSGKSSDRSERFTKLITESNLVTLKKILKTLDKAEVMEEAIRSVFGVEKEESEASESSSESGSTESSSSDSRESSASSSSSGKKKKDSKKKSSKSEKSGASTTASFSKQKKGGDFKKWEKEVKNRIKAVKGDSVRSWLKEIPLSSSTGSALSEYNIILSKAKEVLQESISEGTERSKWVTRMWEASYTDKGAGETFDKVLEKMSKKAKMDKEAKSKLTGLFTVFFAPNKPKSMK